jgi:hypothetical protein
MITKKSTKFSKFFFEYEKDYSFLGSLFHEFIRQPSSQIISKILIPKIDFFTLPNLREYRLVQKKQLALPLEWKD